MKGVRRVLLAPVALRVEEERLIGVETEAALVATVYAIAVGAFAYRTLTIRALYDALTEAASSSAVALTKRQRRLAPSSHRNLAENDYYSEAGDCIRQIFRATPYDVCPAESFYWGERRAQPSRASLSTPTCKPLRAHASCASAPRLPQHTTST